MADMNEVHNYDRSIKLNNKSLQNSDQVCNENKQAVSRFIDKCYAEGIGGAAIRKYVSNFHTMLKMAPENFKLLDSDQEDLEKLVAIINRSDYSEYTKKGFKVGLKKFYKTMEGNGESHPEKIGFVSAVVPPNKRKDPDPLDKKEIEEIINACSNDRDRAMYKVLYESGARAGELISLKIKDIKFVENGVRVSLDGKTGPRQILLVESERYLRTWLSKHPNRDQRNAPLWVKTQQQVCVKCGENKTRHPEEKCGDFVADLNDPVNYDYMRINLKRKATEACVRIERKDDGGKTSEVHPHLFRHSRATHLATELTEAAMKQYFGWSQGSDMPQTYIHLSGRDIESEIMQMYGVQDEKEENEKQECQRCFKTYKGNEKFCPRCGAPLNQENALKVRELENIGQDIISKRLDGMDRSEILKEFKE